MSSNLALQIEITGIYTVSDMRLSK